MVQEPFRVGFVPGVTPDTWAARWRERERRPLELVQVAQERQRAAIDTAEVHMVLARLPIDVDDLHLIPLYKELPVVVMSVDNVLSLLDDLGAADLVGEVVNDGPVAEAVATAAAGTGVVHVPMSVARAHHRKDVTFRVLRDGEPTQVGLAWWRDLEDPGVETFVGVVRGRTAGSSRDAQERGTVQPAPSKPKATRKKPPARKEQGRGAPRGRRRR